MLRQKSWMTSATTSGALYVSSVIAIPICYVVTNTVKFHVDEDSKGFALLCFGLMSMAFICAVTRALVGKDESPFLYAFTVGAFGSVINLMIALENDEWIHGFINGYLEKGEPYLISSYGTMLSYWGGIGHYIMYLMMVASIAWRQPFRDTGLYWIGSMLHGMLVLIVGVLSSTDQLHWPFILHVPFVVTPVICAFYFLHYKPQTDDKKKKIKLKKETLNECLKALVTAIKNLTQRGHDLWLILMFAIAIGISIFRGLAALGSGLAPFKAYREEVEPYMKDPVGFPRIQLLVYMFCFVPCYVMIIYGLLYPNKRWMPDFALLHAGAAIQAQIVHIGGSINQRTMFIYRVPEDNFAQFIFWPVNIILLVVPQLLAIRCMYDPQFFGLDDGNEVNVKSKKCVDGVVEITASDSFSKSARATPPRCCTPVGAGPTSLLSVDDNVGMQRLEDERKSQATTPMLKVKFGGSNSISGEEIAMSLQELKTYHDDLRRLSASATGRNTRRHLSDGGLLPGNIHVRRASGSGRKLTDDDMIQLESLSPKLIAESLKQCGDSGPPSPSGSFESSHEQWMLGNRRRRRGSNCSNQGNGPRGDLNMETLMEEKLPDFDDGITPASSMSIN